MVTSHLVRRVITYTLLWIILWTPIFIGMTRVAFAADEFGTSYDVVYDVGDDGITTVTEKVTLKNLTSQYYANQFKLTIGATQISDVKASDGSGPMEVSTQQKDSSTIINVKFNQQVAGLGKTLPWTLTFKSRDFAEKMGKVWEIRAPKISSTSNLESYNLILSVPLEFGEPTLISPTPGSQTTNSGRMFLTFNKERLINSGISASFGTNQLFDFDLTYHLENNNLVPILTNIALPPDSAYQDVIFQRIEPKPLNVTLDNDGNYLAWYRLQRRQKEDIKVIGSTRLYTVSKVKNPALNDDLRKKYTQYVKYWEKDNPQIVSKLEEILGSNPSSDPVEKERLIYRFVVDSLKYDSKRLKGDSIERLGATTVLNNPSSAVCMEFTDLFIALSRAAGIPARELDGFAYTANTALRPLSWTGASYGLKDVLHAWPEYWSDTRGWVMVDPTWENTTGGVDYFNKLDLSHFVFAIKGSSSEFPVPAGSYKYANTDTQDVKVTLTDNDFLGKPQLDVQINVSNPMLAGFPAKASIKITNSGNAIFPANNLLISSQSINILNSRNINLGPIPSFGSANFEFDLRTRSLFDKFNDQITVQIGNQKFTRSIFVQPFFLFQTLPIMLVVAILGMGLLYGVILFVLIYRKRFKKTAKKSK